MLKLTLNASHFGLLCRRTAAVKESTFHLNVWNQVVLSLMFHIGTHSTIRHHFVDFFFIGQFAFSPKTTQPFSNLQTNLLYFIWFSCAFHFFDFHFLFYSYFFCYIRHILNLFSTKSQLRATFVRFILPLECQPDPCFRASKLKLFTIVSLGHVEKHRSIWS